MSSHRSISSITSSSPRRAAGRLLIGTGVLVGVVGLGAGLGMSAAGAAPSNAPSALTGTFSCVNGDTGTFVVNSGNSHAATTWDVAHLAFSSGGTGIFVPTELNLTFSFNGQSFTSDVIKGSAPSSVSCDISAAQGGFSLTGVVTGTIVHNG